ncbi:hypothetical protein Bpfe_030532 [Biomphalaria pfeifferi]|uniref:Uncharacterized protein n=1 Tax=Biomphalaria pfeifferi TaxID=112525 RepID=A0AAD8APH0_BIOPF|nr:hypothetical protein Bpfe_030532 [Biomphalaria pfeifferi]
MANPREREASPRWVSRLASVRGLRKKKAASFQPSGDGERYETAHLRDRQAPPPCPGSHSPLQLPSQPGAQQWAGRYATSLISPCHDLTGACYSRWIDKREREGLPVFSLP